MLTHHKGLLQNLFSAAIDAVAPDGAVLRSLRLEKNNDGDILWVKERAYSLKNKKVLLLGAGKGVAPMAKAMEELLGEHIEKGLVIAKYDHGLELSRVELREASHPMPDMAGVEATAALLEMAAEATEEHLVICLFTGGASALTPSPAADITLEHIQATTAALLACGATIHEINAVRKHLSTFSGGQLARLAQPAPVVGLMVSDVIGDSLDVIASGPTVPDASTYASCLAVVQKYSIERTLPTAVMQRLLAGAADELADTPKAEDAFFANVQNELVATNSEALEAMEEYATQQGFTVCVLEDSMQGEARLMAESFMGMAKAMQKELQVGDAPVCLLGGGETTVQIVGTGRGGRNQEMALASGLLLDGHEGIFVLYAGTDGSDGPTDATGGFAHGASVTAMQAYCNPHEMLGNNDSYAALKAGGDIFITGPTRTNVMDVAAVLIYPLENSVRD